MIVLAMAEPPSFLTRMFHDVAFVIGDPWNRSDLMLAGVSAAAEVIVGTGVGPNTTTHTDLDPNIRDRLADHRIVCLAGLLESMLGDHTLVAYQLWGRGCSRLLPKMMDQAGTPLADVRPDSDWRTFLSPRFAAGSVIAPSSIGAFSGREFYFTNTEEIINAFICPDSKQSSGIFLVPLPASHVGIPFKQLLKDWSTECVALGLYRPFVRGEMHPGSQRYVCTAPSGDTILSAEDKVYVIAPIEWAKAALNFPDVASWRKELENFWAKRLPEDAAPVLTIL